MTPTEYFDNLNNENVNLARKWLNQAFSVSSPRTPRYVFSDGVEKTRQEVIDEALALAFHQGMTEQFMISMRERAAGIKKLEERDQPSLLDRLKKLWR